MEHIMNKIFLIALIAISLSFFACGENKSPEEKQQEETQKQQAADNYEDLLNDDTVSDTQTLPSTGSTTTTENNQNADNQNTTTQNKGTSNIPADIKRASKINLDGGTWFSASRRAKIVALSDVASGNFRKLNKDIAKNLINKGETLGILMDGEVYLLFNKDGSSYSRQLAGYANNNEIIVAGTIKKIDDTNILVVDAMEGAN